MTSPSKGSPGGLARARKLSKKRRIEIARKAGLAGRGIPRPGSGRKKKPARKKKLASQKKRG